MSRIAAVGRPLYKPGITERSAIESAKLPAAPLQRISRRREQRSLTAEFEDVGRKSKRQLSTVTMKIADSRVHSAELIRPSRLGS